MSKQDSMSTTHIQDRLEANGMKSYTVHIFPIVRVTVRNVHARSQEDAIKQAETATDLHEMFASGVTEYAEDVDCFHVDEDGDAEYEHSTWYDKEYRPL